MFRLHKLPVPSGTLLHVSSYHLSITNSHFHDLLLIIPSFVTCFFYLFLPLRTTYLSVHVHLPIRVCTKACVLATPLFPFYDFPEVVLFVMFCLFTEMLIRLIAFQISYTSVINRFFLPIFPYFGSTHANAPHIFLFSKIALFSTIYHCSLFYFLLPPSFTFFITHRFTFLFKTPSSSHAFPFL